MVKNGVWFFDAAKDNHTGQAARQPTGLQEKASRMTDAGCPGWLGVMQKPPQQNQNRVTALL